MLGYSSDHLLLEEKSWLPFVLVHMIKFGWRLQHQNVRSRPNPWTFSLYHKSDNVLHRKAGKTKLEKHKPVVGFLEMTEFSFKVYSFCFRLFCFFWFRVPVGFFIKILFKDNYFKINIKIRFFSHLSCFKNIIYYFLIRNLFFLKDELTRLFHVKSINPIVLIK